MKILKTYMNKWAKIRHKIYKRRNSNANTNIQEMSNQRNAN